MDWLDRIFEEEEGIALPSETPSQEIERWHITNDEEAEWAIRKIVEAKKKIEYWKEYYKEALKKVQDPCDNSVAFFEHALDEYFQSVPHKATKTQEKYDLPSGSLVKHLPKMDYKVDEEALNEWAKTHAPEYVKTETRWGDLKKTLQILEDGSVIQKDTGEVVSGVTGEMTEAKFSVTLKKG